MTRRDTLKLGLWAALMTTTGLARAQDLTLDFDPEAYRELTATITTAQGDVEVTYRFWKALVYVARPVDAAYQCLNLSVPVTVGGKPVDATRAPILFANSVGGYMPSAVGEAGGVGEGGMMPPPGAGQGGQMPQPPAGATEAPSGSNAMMAGGQRVSNAKLALAAGYVVVEPGARGRTLVDASGTYYGTAPAAIVDLKAALRYLRAFPGIPGDKDRIVSSGTSAGGALSSLLGATGDSPDYLPYLQALGAAETSDAIFAAGCWCPITDLDHADLAYEWNWGGNPLQDGSAPDTTLSLALAEGFPAYQSGLALTTPDGAALTAEAMAQLTLSRLRPEATAYLAAQSETDRKAYLDANPHIGWKDGAAVFDWAAFLAHVGPRKKSVPAFDALDLSSGENNLFGTGQTRARHFTAFAAEQTGTTLDDDIPALVHLMNPMPYLAKGTPARAPHWWLRTGAKDTDTSLTVLANLEAAARASGAEADLRYYWDAGHGANEDAADFLAWIGRITGTPPL